MEKYPRDWLRLLCLETSSPIEEVNTNLPSVSKDADKIFIIKEQVPWLLHLEMQSSRDPGLPIRILIYNVLAYARHKLPVHSVVILLRPEADFSDLTGRLQYSIKEASGLEMRYQIVRLWELPVAAFLNGGLGTVPLAPLGKVSGEDLPALMDQMDERISRDIKGKEAGELWALAYIILGLRCTSELSKSLIKGIPHMKESLTYQAIIAEGEAKGEAKDEAKGEAKGKAYEARRILILIGTHRMGPPSDLLREQIEHIDSLELLERLAEQALDSKTWDDLLAQA